MTQHTPGPWREFVDADSHDILAIDGLHVAEVMPVNGIDPQAEQDANARLIAAAPELLAALMTLTVNAQAVHSYGLPDDVPPLTAVAFHDAQVAARKAIAKAGGR